MPGQIINNQIGDEAQYQTIYNNWSEDTQKAPYDVYLILPAYFVSTGAIQMPVCGLPTFAQVGASGPGQSPSPCEIVQVAAPYGEVVVSFLSQRVGIPPTVPDPRPPSQASNYVLLEYAVMPPTPRLEADGTTYIWTAGGVYVYALRVPITPSDGYQVGAAPYQTLNSYQMIFGAENFVQTIFNLY